MRRRRRPSSEAGALPIREGLAIRAGLGAVLPAGLYNAQIQASNGVTVGNNIYDIAPSIAFTYTTPPLLADGTEFSSKIYLNNYFNNPATNISVPTTVGKITSAGDPRQVQFGIKFLF